MSFYGFGDSVTSGMERSQKLIANAEQMKRQRAYLNMQQQYAQMAQDRWDVQKQQELQTIKATQMKLDQQEIMLNQQNVAQGMLAYRETGNFGMLNNFIANNEKVSNALKAGLGGSVFKSPADYSPEALKRMQGYSPRVETNGREFMVVLGADGKETILPSFALAVVTGASSANAQLATQFSQDLAVMQQMNASQVNQNQIAKNLELDETQKTNLLAQEAFQTQNINKAIMSNSPTDQKKLYGTGEANIMDEIDSAKTPDELFAVTLNNPKNFKGGSQEALYLASKALPLIEQEFLAANPDKEFSFSSMPKQYQQRIAALFGKPFEQFQKDMVKEKGFGAQDAIVKAIAAVKSLDENKAVPYIQSIQNDVSKFLGTSLVTPQDLQLYEVHHSLGLVTDLISRERSGAALNMQEITQYKDDIGSLSENKKYILSGLKTQLGTYISKLEKYKTIYGTQLFDFMFGKKLDNLKTLYDITEQGIQGKIPNTQNSSNNLRYNTSGGMAGKITKFKSFEEKLAEFDALLEQGGE